MLTPFTRSEDERIAASTVVVRPLSLKSNFAWTLSGNVVYSACQWGMLVLLAKLGTPATVGEFALAVAIAVAIAYSTNQDSDLYDRARASTEYAQA